MKNAILKTIVFCLLCLALTDSASANVPGGGTGTGANVTLTNGSTTAVLANGIITATVTKANATVTSMLYKGFQVVSSQSGAANVYFSFDGGTSYQNPSNCVFTVVTQTTDMVDVSCKHFYTSSDQHVLDIDIHYVLRRGASGLYVYAVLTHAAAYAGTTSPATTFGEWRMVWWVPRDPKNTNNYLLENIYVDALRNGPAPSYYDFSQSTVTSIQEISLINTGPQAGTYFSKYEFAADYTDIGCWGHASDVNQIGAWVVLANDEFLNDGPNMQDLTVAQGYSLLHFGRDHYGGSTTTVAAGETWSKTFGPYLLYLNSGADGNACWADAKAQVTAEESAWPYSWLTTAADYPSAAQRGAVTGKFLVTDPLKPAQTGAGAWVGVSQPDPGGNWQYESKRYQYWAKAGADGTFTIPNIRPGAYTLSAYVTGEVGEYTGAATVTAGGITQLGNVVWNVTHPGKSIAWEIGVPDRTAAEFRHGSTDYFQGYLYKTFVNDLPNPLEYTVGSSHWATDWNYAHSALTNTDGTITGWKWRVHFNLPTLPASGNATLTIASAGSNSAHMYLYVNNESASVPGHRLSSQQRRQCAASSGGPRQIWAAICDHSNQQSGGRDQHHHPAASLDLRLRQPCDVRLPEPGNALCRRVRQSRLAGLGRNRGDARADLHADPDGDYGRERHHPDCHACRRRLLRPEQCSDGDVHAGGQGQQMAPQEPGGQHGRRQRVGPDGASVVRGCGRRQRGQRFGLLDPAKSLWVQTGRC